MRKIFFLVFTVSVLIGCTNASEEDLIEETEQPIIVTYNSDVKAIIDNNCLACHTNPPVNGAPNSLINYNNVKDAVENRNLISRISGIGPGPLMPLGGSSLPQNLINLIIQWEADGLLEN
jgi:hypothetical protein